MICTFTLCIAEKKVNVFLALAVLFSLTIKMKVTFKKKVMDKKKVAFFLAMKCINTIANTIYSMANHRAKEPRVQMRVPVSFRDSVLKLAHALEIDATVYLEKVTVIYNDK